MHYMNGLKNQYHNFNIIDLSKERLKIAETRFNVGSGTKTDMLQAKIDLNTQETNLLEIQKQINDFVSHFGTLHS